MKLRIRGDSIRLRLTQTDLATLSRDGSIAEYTRLSPHAAFEYRLTADPAVDIARVTLRGETLEVRLPSVQIERWATSSEVGIEARQPNGGDAGLLVLVEKDFPCLTVRPHEDDSDAFARPVNEG